MTTSTLTRASRFSVAGQNVKQLQARYPLIQLAALVIICIYAFASIEGLANPFSIKAILVLASFLGLAAIGQTAVVLLGGLDLSIPGFILLGAFMTTKLAGGSGWPLPWVFPCVVLLAALGGLLSGYISHRYEVQPLIVTLGIGTVVTGVVLAWVAGQPSPPAPAVLADLTRPTAETLGIPLPPVVVIWIALAIIVEVLLRKTVVGRQIYLTGSNPRAADLALVPTGRLWACGFALSAVSAAVVGMLLTGFGGSAEVGIGDPYLFQSLTAVIVGGTAFGARGDYLRTAIGVLILTLLGTVLLAQGYAFADQQIVFGLLILVAVFAYARDRRLADQI